MPLIQAKCMSCGGNLVYDSEKEIATCPFCNATFILERTINNYYEGAKPEKSNIARDKFPPDLNTPPKEPPFLGYYCGKNNEFGVFNGKVEKYVGDNTTEVISIPIGRMGEVREIGNGVFAGNKHIRKLIIPDIITSISDGAFEGCENLEEVEIQHTGLAASNTLKVGPRGFKDCVKLFEMPPIPYIEVSHESFANTGIKKVTKNFCNLDWGTFRDCKDLEELECSGWIGDQCFENCTNLRIIKADYLSSIETEAFSQCTSLEFISIESGRQLNDKEKLEKIGSEAFKNCSSLSSFPDILYNGCKIGPGAFDGCSKLTSFPIIRGCKENGYVYEDSFANTPMNYVITDRFVEVKSLKPEKSGNVQYLNDEDAYIRDSKAYEERKSTFVPFVIQNMVLYPDLEIRLSNFSVIYKGKPVKLLPLEVDILFLMASNPGVSFSRNKLLNIIWKNDSSAGVRTVDCHMRTIRKTCMDTANWKITGEKNSSATESYYTFVLK